MTRKRLQQKAAKSPKSKQIIAASTSIIKSRRFILRLDGIDHLLAKLVLSSFITQLL